MDVDLESEADMPLRFEDLRVQIEYHRCIRLDIAKVEEHFRKILALSAVNAVHPITRETIPRSVSKAVIVALQAAWKVRDILDVPHATMAEC